MEEISFAARSIDELEQIITRCESAVGRLRAIQMKALRELDRLQAPLADGCRSMGEWVTGRLDVAPDTAKELVATAKRLDELPAVEEALHTVGDRLPDTPGTRSRATRNADALWKMAQDALDGDSRDAAVASAPLVTVFVDANQTAATNGESGVIVESGPKVGPVTLEAIICNGTVEVIAVTDNATPLNLGRRTRVVSPQLRRYVLHRDGGVCTADGCTSRYRLQAHHITPWSEGGTTDAANLTTLCWYHHHVIIHGEGFTIDPESPPCRRRLLRPRDHDPP